MTDERALPAPVEAETESETAAWPQTLVFLGAIVLLLIALLPRNGAAERVHFISPEDGATVPTTFTVEMGAEGLTVEPATGEVVEGAGHFHLLINTDFVPVGEVIPADEQHIHFGDGATVTELTLEPGEYVLRLQFADGTHTALNYTDEITITVEGE
ncbi:MAG: hypothetical protein OHK0046_14310 [Anaerolineae bacterium]